MKAIIIAAGMGSRLRPHTDHKPKCMVEVAGRPMIHHQLEAFKACGIDDVVVVRGYKGGGIYAPGARFMTNHDYPNNNILESFFCAGDELVGDLLISYGDIVYHPHVLEGLLASSGAISLVVDRDWRTAYEGRTDHPEGQAELCVATGTGVVQDVGKHVPGEHALGEFIGLARVEAAAMARMWTHYLRGRRNGLDLPFGYAKTLRKAYLTDLFNVAIATGEKIRVSPIQGMWREIDTVQDLERAQAVVDW